MSEDFEFDRPEDVIHSVNRYEDMLKKNDLYFFDSNAFENIIHFYLEKDEVDKALAVTELAISQHSYDATFHITKAEILILKKEYGQALESIEQAEVLEPSLPETVLLRSHIYIKMGKYSLFEEMARGLNKNGELPEINYFQLADFCLVHGDLNFAIYFYKKALEENPDNEDILFDLAYAYDDLENYEESLKIYIQLIDLDPYSPDAWYGLGNCYHYLGKYEEAVDAYDYAILINETFSSAYYNKANSMVKLEKYEEAIPVYKQCLEFESPNSEAYCAIGECYEKLGNLKQAREYYKKSVKIDPNMADAWYGIGSTLDYEERYFEALHYFKKAVNISPKNPDFWFAIADMHFHLNNFQESEEGYRKVVELAPDDVTAWLDFSTFYYDLNDLDKAIAIIDEALSHIENSPDLLYRMVTYQFSKGSYNTAVNYLELALHSDPEKHEIIFEHLPILKENKMILDIIKKYTDK